MATYPNTPYPIYVVKSAIGPTDGRLLFAALGPLRNVKGRWTEIIDSRLPENLLLQRRYVETGTKRYRYELYQRCETLLEAKAICENLAKQFPALPSEDLRTCNYD